MLRGMTRMDTGGSARRWFGQAEVRDEGAWMRRIVAIIDGTLYLLGGMGLSVT